VVRVRLLDEARNPIDGYGFDDVGSLTSDDIRLPIWWKRPLKALRGKTLHLEFELRNASIYSFDLR
jgi:hypothetical protein